MSINNDDSVLIIYIPLDEIWSIINSIDNLLSRVRYLVMISGLEAALMRVIENCDLVMSIDSTSTWIQVGSFKLSIETQSKIRRLICIISVHLENYLVDKKIGLFNGEYPEIAILDNHIKVIKKIYIGHENGL